MRSKRTEQVNKAFHTLHADLQEQLMKDFSAPLAARIIEHNVRKYHIRFKNNDEFVKLINGILSDYRAINPVGCADSAVLKKDLEDAIRRRAG